MLKNNIKIYSLIFSVFIFLSCGGSQERKIKFLNKGKKLYQKGDYTKAKLNIKNSILIDSGISDDYYFLGLINLKEKNIKKAYVNFTKALDLNEKHNDASIQAGKICLAEKKLDLALDYAERVLFIESENHDALFLKGDVFLEKKEIKKAKQIFYKLLNTGINKPEIYMKLFSAHIAEKEHSNAERVLIRGIYANPSSVDLQLYLSDLYWDLGYEQKALNIIKNIDMFDKDKKSNLAKFYISKGKLNDAEKELKKEIYWSEQNFNLYVLLSSIYIDQGDNKKAIKVLKKYLSINKTPADSEFIYINELLLKLFFQEKKYISSKKYINKVLKYDPNNINAHFINGNIYLEKQDFDNAVFEFEIVLEKSPDFIPGYCALSKVYCLKNEVNISINILEKALKINPESKQILNYLADSYILNSDYDKAGDCYLKILNFYPDDYLTRISLSDLLIVMGENKKAEFEYKKAINIYPDYDQGYYKLAFFYEKQKKRDKAVAWIKKGLKKNQDSKILFSFLIQLYIKQEKYNTAISECREWIKDIQEDAFFYDLLGKIYVEKKQYTDAELYFKKAIDMNFMWFIPYENLLRIYIDFWDKNDVILKLQSNIEEDPASVSDYFLLACFYELVNKPKEAINIYEKLLELKSDFWPALNNIAFLISENYEYEQDLDKALLFAKKAGKIKPDNSQIIDTLGWVFYKKNNIKKAFKKIKTAFLKAPEKPIINYHMGMVYYKKSEYKKAEKLIQKALKAEKALFLPYYNYYMKNYPSDISINL